MKLSANLSVLFPDIPFLDRPHAAHRAGFTDVECWWPFADPEPDDREVNDFVKALDTAGVALRSLNLFAGDMKKGDRGILSHPDAVPQFRANLTAVLGIAEATGCRHFNALYGQRLGNSSSTVQDTTALENLERAGKVLDAVNGIVLIEPLTRGENGDYPLTTIDEVLAVIDSVGAPSNQLLFDAFHLHNNGADVIAEVNAYGARIGHIQIADSPGRGQPGTGAIAFDAFFDAVAATGYDGYIGCEYKPQGLPAAHFDWVKDSRYFNLIPPALTDPPR